MRCCLPAAAASNPIAAMLIWWKTQCVKSLALTQLLLILLTFVPPPIRSCYLEHFHITDIQKSYLLFGWTHELAMHSLIDCNESKRARPDLFDPVHAHDPLLLVDLERAFWSVNACLSIWATLWSGPGSETTRWSHQSSWIDYESWVIQWPHFWTWLPNMFNNFFFRLPHPTSNFKRTPFKCSLWRCWVNWDFFWPHWYFWSWPLRVP